MALDEHKQHINVLLVAFAAQSHINPMLRLGKRLALKGVDVTLATTDPARELHPSAASIGGIHLEFFSDGLPFNYPRNSNLDHFMDSLIKVGPTNLKTLIQNHPKKFSCIINNPFVAWAADVAAELNIPCAMLWIQPCTLFAIYYRFYNKLNSFPTITNPDMSVKLPGLPLLTKDDLPTFVLPSNQFKSFARMLEDVFRTLYKLKWVLCNSFQELENDVIESINAAHQIRPVGPLVPSVLFGKEDDLDGGVNLFEAEDTCIEWLNKQHPSSVIYIAFGSLTRFTEKETESIAFALKKTKRPFLWVMKSAKESEEIKEPFRALDEIRDQGLIVKWSPQTQVLAHPSVGCFLSHCGWNSLIETLAAGVPVIAYPSWTDQPTNAKLVTDVWKVGVRITDGKYSDGISGEEVVRCLEEVMGGPRSAEYKRNAAEVKQAAGKAVADGGSSDRNIQWLVDEINVFFFMTSDHQSG